MDIRKKCIVFLTVIALITSVLPAAVMASESYDMKYFRFLASQSGAENLPENVKVQDKKWTTGEAQKAGDYFIIDMYQEQEVGKVILSHDENEYPGKYNVYISTKMEDFGEPIIENQEGKALTQTVIDFPTLENIRFIKIELVEGTDENSNAWSINSLRVLHANDASSKVKHQTADTVYIPTSIEIHEELEKSLGIDIDSFNGTRASFAALLVSLTNSVCYSDVKGTYFTDVNTSTENALEIEAIASYVDSYVFSPQKEILLDDAVEWIINALGYKKVVSYAGADKEGYRKIAEQLKLLKNVKSGYGQKIDRASLVELFYNTLMSPMCMESALVDTTDYSLAAYKWHDIIEVTGNLVSNSYTSRSGEQLVSNNHIMIDDTKYYDAEGLANECIGLNVIAYVKVGMHGAEPKVLYLAPNPKKSEITVIPGVNIKSGDLRGISYYNDVESRQIKRVTFDKHPDMIYNGKGCTPFKEEKLESVKNGYITIIDSDNNGKIDLIKIEEYVDYFVSYIDRNKLIVSDMYNNTNICLSDNSQIKYTVYSDDKEISFGDIKSKSIISVSADATFVDENGVVRVDTEKASIYKIFVSEKTVKGEVTTTSDELYSVDGIEFEKSVYFEDALKTEMANIPTIGQNYTFYMNFMGKISAMDVLNNNNIEYGLIAKIKYNKRDERVEMKIVTSTGKLEEFVAAEKVKIDGGNKEIFDLERAKSIFYGNVENQVFDAASSSLITVTEYQLIPQIIGYSMNKNGDLAAIDTMQQGANETKFQSLTHRNSEEYVCNEYRGMVYPTGNKSTSPNLNFGSALIFVGPSNINDADISKDYQVYGKSYFQHDKKYKMEIYKYSEFNNLEIAFIHDGATSTATADNYILVDKVRRQLDKNDEVVTRIEGIQGGQKFVGDLFSDDVLISANLYENGSCILKRGDLITVAMNQSGQIVSIKRLFDVTNKNIALSNNGKYYQERRTTIGKVYKSSGGSLMVTSSKAVTDNTVEDSLELFNLPGEAIVYDEENDEVRAATSGDIRAYKNVHSDSITSLVFVLTTWGLNKSFVIYNFE